MIKQARVLAALLFLCTAAHAGAVRQSTLEEVIAKSSLIVIGEVSNGHEVGSSYVKYGTNQYAAQIIASPVLVTEVWRGTLAQTNLEVEWVLPHTPSGGIGYHSLPPGFRILFLDEKDGHYTIADPGLPSVPGFRGVVESGSLVVQRVIGNLSAVALDPEQELNSRREAVGILSRLDNPAIQGTFRKLLNANVPELFVSALCALLQRNDWLTLDSNLSFLLRPVPQEFPWYSAQNLASAIATGINSNKAINSLGKLLEGASDVRIRRSAASALRRPGDDGALKYLAKGLQDVVEEVRYESVIGLADLSHQPDERPLQEDFVRHESRFIDYWLAWANDQNLSQ
jgi:FOG: HEAT repeat